MRVQTIQGFNNSATKSNYRGNNQHAQPNNLNLTPMNDSVSFGNVAPKCFYAPLDFFNENTSPARLEETTKVIAQKVYDKLLSYNSIFRRRAYLDANDTENYGIVAFIRTSNAGKPLNSFEVQTFNNKENSFRNFTFDLNSDYMSLRSKPLMPMVFASDAEQIEKDRLNINQIAHKVLQDIFEQMPVE